MIKTILLLFLFINPPSFSEIQLSSQLHFSRDVDHLSKRKVPIPHLVGLTLSEAMKVLAKKKLEVGLIFADKQIKNFYISELTVYLQNPKSRKEDGAQNYIYRGEQIDLWVTYNASPIDSLRQY